MIVEFLVGILIGVLFIDRLHLIVGLFPFLFDKLYLLIFSPLRVYDNPQYDFDEPEILDIEKHIEIPVCVDDSLTALMEAIFAHYLDPIMINFNMSKDFSKRVRQVVQHFFSDFYHRFSKVDPKFLVYHGFIPKILYHLRMCKKSKNSAHCFDSDTVRRAYLSDQIHCGVLFHDNDEDIYLKKLFESILRISLPENQRKSRISIFLVRSIITFNVFKPLIDFLSDPVNIKWLVYQFTLSESIVYDHSVVVRKVPILRNFVNPTKFTQRIVICPPKNLRVTWSQLQTNPSLMYVFIQAFKRNSTFVFPHFCITYSEWSSKINKLDTHGPISKKEQIGVLIDDARRLYTMFVHPESFHRVKFKKELVKKVEELDFGEISEENLTKMHCLFTILHNLAFFILNTECLDYFYHSSQFFMLCFGERPKLRDLLSSYHILQSRKALGLQNVLDLHTRNKTPNYDSIECDSEIESDEDLDDGTSLESTLADESTNIDLSEFIVKIIELKSTIRKNEKIYYYVMQITKTNSNDESYKRIVQRTYKEFYTLENRLKHFHGPRIKTPLNPKRSFLLEKNMDYLKQCIKPFQEYLDSLLQNEYLRYSTLLNSFFTDEEVINSQSFFSRTTLVTGRAIQSVIGTLSNQKGKYIDIFLLSFLQTTESNKQKIIHKSSLNKLKRRFSFLKDEYVRNPIISKLHYTKPKVVERRLIYDIMITLIDIINPTNWYSSLMHMLYAIFGGLAELIFKRWLSEKLDNFLHPESLANMINSVKDFVLSITNDNNISPRSESFFEPRESSIFYDNKFSFLNIEESSQQILDLFDHRELNKQLIYNLFDDTLAAIYPELTHYKPEASFEEVPDDE